MVVDTPLTISNFKLHIIGNSLSIKHHTQVIKEYNISMFDFRYTDCIVNSILITMVMSSSYNLTLSNVHRMMASAFFVLYQRTISALLYMFMDLVDCTFDIMDFNDCSLLRSSKLSTYNCSWEWQSQFLNQVVIAIPLSYHTCCQQ